MDSEFAKKLLDILIDNAIRIMSAGFGVDRAESSFFDVVRLLRAEKVLKDYFLEKVRLTFGLRDAGRLEPGIVPTELIELVAHELRWPELLVMAKKRINDFFHGDGTLAMGDIARRLSEAYKDDWQDRVFYEHYKR